MKKYSVITILTLSLCIIMFGRYHYSQKLLDITVNAQERVHISDNTRLEGTDEKKDGGQSNASNLNERLHGVNNELAEVIKTRLSANDTVSIIAFGSQALIDSQDEGIVPWPIRLEEKLNDAYDTDLFSVETISLGKTTSLEMIQEGRHDELAEERADIYLIEPLIWNDNGQVSIDHSTEHLSMLMDSILSYNDEAVVFVMPSQPAYNTVNYPKQIAGLGEFAEAHDIFYHNHWEDFPSLTDDNLLKYVDKDDHRMPTEKGHDLWSDSVLRIFIP
ncbi:SGNH/GDSL hydrolase family protein [Salipaludibacillus agaradhaerens]|uniref:SGNH/GDSL hydrolase family protein n=1 Tax=Salipaludibacillus agaradhaerens TaxID=76935 RepID=UPI002150B90E|nr:SGNH/GDSL hydrolase family protein [Salipaludibacillus agaradhaerens]MCR6108080.1 SGNH/GDSL hydrolase family protein [Salipaludibacillus agaradhaerens]MCR6120105.1 SGNH/GDSL hydrolase family protein [Salipaludibacillus agaradhaerens]